MADKSKEKKWTSTSLAKYFHEKNGEIFHGRVGLDAGEQGQSRWSKLQIRIAGGLVKRVSGGRRTDTTPEIIEKAKREGRIRIKR